MSGAVVITAVFVVLTTVLAAVWNAKVAHARRMRSDVVSYRLRFPRDLTADAVAAFLSGIAGWSPPRWRRWFSVPTLTIEMTANRSGIAHWATVPSSWAVGFERLLVAHIPGVRFELTAPPELPALTMATTYRLSSALRPLRIDPQNQARTLLSAAQPLGEGEHVCVQLVLAPHGPVSLPSPGGSRSWTPFSARSAKPVAIDMGAWRRKVTDPQLLTVIRIGVASPDQHRSRGVLRRMEVALHLSTAAGAHLRRRWLPSVLVARALSGRRQPLTDWPIVLGTNELVGLSGWPVGVEQMQGLELAGCRPLRASDVLPREGLIIGDSTASSLPRPVAVRLEDLRRHLLLVGPTGAGKSTVCHHLIDAAIRHGHAVAVVDPKAGDLVNDVAATIPEERLSDVFLLDADPAGEWVLGFNPLRQAGGDPGLASENCASVLHRIFHDSWGVRTDAIVRAALATIAVDPHGSLIDVVPLLTDAAVRRQFVARVHDPLLLSWWSQFELLSDADKTTHIAPVLTKLRSVLGRPGVRRMLAQPEGGLDLGAALNGTGIVLVPLAAGRIGQDTASLLGALVLNSIWAAVQARATLPPAKRKPVLVVLDELSAYSHLPISLDEFLSQCRAYGVAVVAATQHLHQVSPDMRHALLANCRSRVAWQLGHADAQVMAREFGAGLSVEDLQSLAAFEVVAQLFTANRTQPAATLMTRPAPTAEHDPAVVCREALERHGKNAAEVDQWIVDRVQGRPTKRAARTAPGRKQRQP